MRIIRVAASSRPRDTAGAIAGIIREDQVADVRAIGRHAQASFVSQLSANQRPHGHSVMEVFNARSS